MAKFEYSIPPSLSTSDTAVLSAKREACFGVIYGVSLRWIASEDDRGRRLFRLTQYTDTTFLYFEGTLDEIEEMDEWQFKQELIRRETSRHA